MGYVRDLISLGDGLGEGRRLGADVAAAHVGRQMDGGEDATVLHLHGCAYVVASPLVKPPDDRRGLGDQALVLPCQPHDASRFPWLSVS